MAPPRLSSEGANDPITEVLLSENDDKLVRSLAEVISARRDAVAPKAELAQADFDAVQEAISKYHAWFSKLGLDEPRRQASMRDSSNYPRTTPGATRQKPRFDLVGLCQSTAHRSP